MAGSDGYFILDNAGASLGMLYWDATGGSGAAVRCRTLRRSHLAELERLAARQFGSLFSVEPAASFQVQAVVVVKSDALPFQQAPLEGVAAITGQAMGHLAPGVDDAVPWNLACWVEALQHAANKAGTSRQAGHCGDLAIGRNPAQGDAADDGANRFDGVIALELDSLKRLALHLSLSSIFGCPALQ